ncbi:hypothetical protein FAVG1_12852 [Fusarium avenaceum]|nr:hypothetical protein FAVG1_12852 [Fusarium avenaceum]
MQTQRETNRKLVQLAQQRADTFERQYQRRLSLAEIQDKADRNKAADEALRLAMEQLERAKAAREERQTEYELAADKHDEALIETGDWDMHLGSLEGLFDGGSEQ